MGIKTSVESEAEDNVAAYNQNEDFAGRKFLNKEVEWSKMTSKLVMEIWVFSARLEDCFGEKENNPSSCGPQKPEKGGNAIHIL